MAEWINCRQDLALAWARCRLHLLPRIGMFAVFGACSKLYSDLLVAGA